MSNITQITASGVETVKKFSPEILAVVGVAGLVTSTVLVARATLKLENVVDQLEEEKQFQHYRHEQGLIDDKELKKALFRVQAKFVGRLGKLYGIPVGLGVASIGALLGGQGVLKKRNVALVGAYKSLEGAYNQYRERVVAEVGEEKEREIRLNLRALGDDENQGDSDDSKPMALLEDQKKSMLGASPYAIYYDRYTASTWTDNPDYNVALLSAQQNVLNEALATKGFLFLNDVYKALGMETTEAGQQVGWIYSAYEGSKDGYIDFGVDQGAQLIKDRYQFEEDGGILLDFNVDGLIADKAWKLKKKSQS